MIRILELEDRPLTNAQITQISKLDILSYSALSMRYFALLHSHLTYAFQIYGISHIHASTYESASASNFFKLQHSFSKPFFEQLDLSDFIL